jgi:hypothetical protein
MGLSTIPRASTATFSGGSTFDAGAAVSILTNRASPGFTHDIKYYFGTTSGTVANGVGTSFSWTPPLSLLAQIPNGVLGNGKIVTTTKSGSTVIGSKETVFYLRAPATAVPTISSLTLSEMDTGIAAAGLTGTWVQAQSILKAVVNATGYQGSTIVDRTFQIGNVVVDSGETIPLTSSGTVTITARVTDSRGRTDSYTQTIPVLAWANPKQTLVLARRAVSSGSVNDSGTYIRVDLTNSVSSLLVGGVQKNTLKIEVFVRARGTTAWGSAKNTINHSATSYSSSFLISGGGVYPIDDSFEVLVRVTDKFTNVSGQTVVPTAAIFMHWSKTGVGIGKFHENGVLDIAGDLYMSGSLKSGSVPYSLLSGAPEYNVGEISGTAAPNTFPQGISYGTVGTGGFPSGVTLGTIMTVRHSDFRQSQTLWERGGSLRMYYRASNGSTAWESWQEISSRQNPSVAYAVAAGTANGVASGDVTVTFPSGRFSVAPRVIVTNRKAGAALVPIINSISATEFAVRWFNIQPVAQEGNTFDWQAIQMNPTAASG